MSLAAFRQKIKTALSFSVSDWKIFFEAHLLFFQVRLSLFLTPARSVERMFAWKPASPVDSKVPRDRLLSLFGAARRFQPDSPACLLSSLTLHRLLLRHGIPSEIKIGVRKKDGGISAHAWCGDPAGVPGAGPFVLLEKVR